MPMQAEYFSAYLNARLEAADVYLPLSSAATADLLSLLSAPEDYIYLTVKDDVSMETVRARNENGTLILDRGLEGTTPALHPFGACVMSVSPTVIAAVKDLICGYTCCEDGDCPCTPVGYEGAVLPEAHVGVDWSGSVVFSGDAPINMGVEAAPAWMTVSQQGGLLRLTGAPTEAGDYTFSVAATNCNGTKLATRALTVTVTV